MFKVLDSLFGFSGKIVGCDVTPKGYKLGFFQLKASKMWNKFGIFSVSLKMISKKKEKDKERKKVKRKEKKMY